MIEKGFADAVDQPRVALDALLEGAEVLDRDMVRLNCVLDGQVMVILQRRVNANVQFEFVRGNLDLVGFFDLLGAAVIGEVPDHDRAEDGDDDHGGDGAPETMAVGVNHGLVACVVPRWRGVHAMDNGISAWWPRHHGVSRLVGRGGRGRKAERGSGCLDRAASLSTGRMVRVTSKGRAMSNRGDHPSPAPVRTTITRLARAYPDARLALDYESPFELLIALILAAQCTDERVNQVTGQVLFRKYRTAADYVRVPAAELEHDIRPTGFFRAKTRSIQGCCRDLVERFGGRVPDRIEDLTSLPGVGRKTANIVLGNAFGKPAIGVDTHVLRLAQRLGLTRQTDPDKVEADLTPQVPAKDRTRFCHLLQFHGRRVCVARKPRCAECVVADLCPYPEKTPPPEPRRPAFGGPVRPARQGRGRASR